ncbi:DgyrCDS1321 [Dimorphilus gyrociliatus]|uniref:DgyrCDS1321 n=1 Tax=Dimorphilus gyrociliatus TaxID=2664684 RepID=A0A7I8V6X4_9ANNE|nr:DgyrCDS1321 [Dimorphilus gyrociliatus]
MLRSVNLTKTFIRSYVKLPLGICREKSVKCYELKSRSVLKITGKDSSSFLQSVITNDMRCLENSCQSLFAFILNPQGRILYDVILYSYLSQPAQSFYLECDHSIRKDLLMLLKKYKIRRNVNLDPEDLTLIHCEEELADCPGLLLQNKDPRVKQFGYRALIEKNKFQDHLENEENYKKKRFELGIGEGIKDHPIAKCFPLESNGVFLHAVAFDKGCYVGQELTARTHHTGATRKRIMPLELSEPINAHSAIICTEEGKSVGVIRDHIGRRAIGLMRVRESVNAKELYAKENVEGETLSRVKTNIPFWWPIDKDERLRQLLGLSALPV